MCARPEHNVCELSSILYYTCCIYVALGDLQAKSALYIEFALCAVLLRKVHLFSASIFSPIAPELDTSMLSASANYADKVFLMNSHWHVSVGLCPKGLRKVISTASTSDLTEVTGYSRRQGRKVAGSCKRNVSFFSKKQRKLCR